jgi:hypothetical protein
VYDLGVSRDARKDLFRHPRLLSRRALLSPSPSYAHSIAFVAFVARALVEAMRATDETLTLPFPEYRAQG